MKITPDLVTLQFAGYARAHGARANLAIHLASAPLFVAGVIGAPGAALAGHYSAAAILLGVALVAFFSQAVGHAREANAPEPFRSPLDVVARVFVEQFVTFPRFVLSGGFARARGAARRQGGA